MSTKIPTQPVPQAPAVDPRSGLLVPVWVQFIAALLAVIAEQDARLTALESSP